MKHPRTPTASSIVVGSLLAGAIGVASLATAATPAGCSSVETRQAPDAAPAPCDRGPFVFCKELPADQPQTPGCSAPPGASPPLSLLPAGSRHPLGCKINYVGTRDEQGDCRLDTVCVCEIPDPGTPQPVTPVDAGDDASLDGGADAADADAATQTQPPAPPPSTPGAPTWHCF